MNVTIGEFLGWICTNIKKTIFLVWLTFWFSAIAASPVFWAYVAKYGPEFFVEQWTEQPVRETQIVVNGSRIQVGPVVGHEYWHVPTIISCVLFDFVFLFVAFSPLIFASSEKSRFTDAEVADLIRERS